MRTIKVYLAGPDVFLPDAKERGKWLVDLVNKRDGLEGHYPLDKETELTGNKLEDGKRIALANMQMVRDCDAVLANLTPFRGPSADCGTVWECAYAKGLGKFVFGYSTYHAQYSDKVIGKVPHDGMFVEDFSSWDNIMLVHGLDGYHAGDVREALSRFVVLLGKKISGE